jgi:hypothetical protein
MVAGNHASERRHSNLSGVKKARDVDCSATCRSHVLALATCRAVSASAFVLSLFNQENRILSHGVRCGNLRVCKYEVDEASVKSILMRKPMTVSCRVTNFRPIFLQEMIHQIRPMIPVLICQNLHVHSTVRIWRSTWHIGARFILGSLFCCAPYTGVPSLFQVRFPNIYQADFTPSSSRLLILRVV